MALEYAVRQRETDFRILQNRNNLVDISISVKNIRLTTITVFVAYYHGTARNDAKISVFLHLHEGV